MTAKESASRTTTISEQIGRGIYWTPRLLSILFCCFLALFSFDVFESGVNLTSLGGFVIHNIPVILLAAVTAAAWKREIVGAIVFWGAAVLYAYWILRGPGFSSGVISSIVTIAVPAALIGTLYWVGWHRRLHLGSRG